METEENSEILFFNSTLTRLTAREDFGSTVRKLITNTVHHKQNNKQTV
jgi:hypothetical protein